MAKALSTGPRPRDRTRTSDGHPRMSWHLKMEARRRGLTRRQLDAERFAVREFLASGRVCPGFTEGQLLNILTQAVAHAPREAARNAPRS